MAVSVLVAANGLPDNNTPPVIPIAGTDRYWIIAVLRSGAWANIPSTITVAGTTDTTLDLIASNNTNKQRVALYGCLDSAIGDTPTNGNGDLSYNADGDTPASSNTILAGIVLEGVDQTTPYTDTTLVGWDVVSSAGAQTTFPFTLDEIVDAMGVAFVSDDSGTATFTLTDNGYAQNGSGPWSQGTNTRSDCAVKAITSESLGQLTTLTSSANDDKGVASIMLLPVAAGTITGTGTPQAQDATVSGTGQREASGSGALSSQSSTVSGVGSVQGSVSGSGSLSASESSVSGSGTAQSIITGSGALQAQPSQVVGDGQRIAQDVGTPEGLESGGSTVVGSGQIRHIGSGALSAQESTASGSGIAGGAISGSGALQAQSSTVVGVGSVASILVVADALQSSSADQANVSVSGSLGVQGVGQSHLVDEPVLTQKQLLAVQGVSQATSVEVIGLSQSVILAVQEAVQSYLVNSVTLDQSTNLGVNNSTQSVSSDQVSLTQSGVLIVDSALHGLISDQISFGAEVTPSSRTYVVEISDRTYLVQAVN